MHGGDQKSGTVGRLAHGARRSVYWVWAIARHPANKGGRLAAERRAVEWHWRTRHGGDAVVTVDGRTRLVARPHQFSAVWTVYDGVHEWEELQFCLRYLRPGDHFVDVGANVGVFSTLVGTRIPGVRITAVEPFPPVREDLLANLALNDLDVTVVDSALSDVAGSATFEVLGRDVLNRLAADDHGGGGGTTSITVPVTTLDELAGGDPPALIKIDVEGSELRVMEGARRLLLNEAAAPVLLFEHAGHGAHFGISPADVRAFLAEVGYGIYLLDGGLSPWHSDDLPPTLNVVACRDVAAVRDRLHSPGGAPAVPPVRVDVEYR
ncbi:MAG TPA: FkbM family methyltransferase [Acidimicrobiales bacterium]|nr:FkbM family methyltransferase [Acidimicrobiales bacterium]